ncbi:ACT domain-containing protein [Oceanirhabdus seepicola]|uniref:acetolactate synthase n=1 Tax=Oceanirhabdus seepicola TaxID=2828781 RepID=A0A9J6P0M9_9CLOT|nr:ACT domain-containing protein [Oceanirhabdus seepicola]MCM1989453.1 ACT domain-containing protein [Oceanirhabdus seepicola]
MNYYCVIILTVNNTAGVMSHITNLFARRAFNLEGILCSRIDDGSLSQVYLLVNKDDRLEQIIKQLMKLYDVIHVSVCTHCDGHVFEHLDKLVRRAVCMYK